MFDEPPCPRSLAIRPADDLTDWMDEGPTEALDDEFLCRTVGMETMECVLGAEKPLADAEPIDLVAIHEELFSSDRL